MAARRKSFYERDREAQGLKYPSAKERAREYERAREELLVPRSALRLGENPETGAPVWIRPEDLNRHLQVIGESGSGKSYFLRTLIEQLLEHRERTGEGFLVLDPHGSLAEFALEACVRRGPELAEQIVYFNLAEQERIPIFNPLRPDLDIFYVANSFVQAVVKVWGARSTMEKPQVAEVLLRTAEVLLRNKLSLAEARFFVEPTERNRDVRKLLLRNVPDEVVRDFWEKVDGLPLREQNEYTAPAGRRFDYILRSALLRRIVGQTLPGLDLARLMDQGGVAIFNLGCEGREITDEEQKLLATLLVQELKTVTMRRKADISRPFVAILDEFGDYVSPETMRILTGARKFGLRCVLVHHNLEQLVLDNYDYQLVAAVLAIKNKVVFGGGPVEETKKIADQVYSDFVDPEKRKLEIYTKSFKPVLTPVILHGGGSGSNEGDVESRVTTTPPEGEPSETEGSARSSGSHAEDSWREAYVTEHEEFEQLSSVQFAQIEEQLFRYMQELHRQPQGQCVVAAMGREPVSCQVPDMTRPSLSKEERARFLERVYAKPLYLTATKADALIEERTAQLLRLAAAPKGKLPKKPADFFEDD